MVIVFLCTSSFVRLNKRRLLSRRSRLVHSHWYAGYLQTTTTSLWRICDKRTARLLVQETVRSPLSLYLAYHRRRPPLVWPGAPSPACRSDTRGQRDEVVPDGPITAELICVREFHLSEQLPTAWSYSFSLSALRWLQRR